MLITQEPIAQSFQEHFGHEPAVVVRAPGRLNLLGDPTDLISGFALSAAIDRSLWIALEPTGRSEVEIHCLDSGQTATVRIDTIDRTDRGWVEYVKAIAWALRERGYGIGGWRGVMRSEVPKGIGLSWSAAMELASAQAFASVSDLMLSPKQMALMARRAENKWIGVACCLLDQLVAASGAEGHALLVDCMSLEMRPVPLPEDYRLVALDTGKRPRPEAAFLRVRESQCQAAATQFGVAHLRNLTVADFEEGCHLLDPSLRGAARHVVTENARALAAAEALEAGRVAELGRLLNESHASLRGDFGVALAELDQMADLAREHQSCLGARMGGAGTTGCVVALVKADSAEDFASETCARYQGAPGHEAKAYICRPADGVRAFQR